MTLKVKCLREENVKLSQLSKASENEKEHIESLLVDAKIKSANLDLENDELACKLQKQNEQIKIFSHRATALEVELLRTK